MNYEMLIYQGAIGGTLLFDLKSSSPFMAVAVGNIIQVEGQQSITVSTVLHQFFGQQGQDASQVAVHRIAVGT